MILTSSTQTASATAIRTSTRTDGQSSAAPQRRLSLLRGPSTDHGTPGVLLREDGSRIAYTLELPWRGNRRMRSSIPPGSYPARYVVTEKRPAGVYLLEGVPGRSSILIHSGNVAGDVEKGLESDVLGCILLGRTRGTRRGQRAVLLSKPAVAAFVAEMKRKPFTVEVIQWTSAQS
jgi:hypothetical protein